MPSCANTAGAAGTAGASPGALPRGPGTYVLVLHLADAQQCSVGSLGRQAFPAGWYLYVGSALSGLAGRLGRHQRVNAAGPARLHWHIDALLARAALREIWYREGRDRCECSWAAALAVLPVVRPHAAGFGASDCHCPTHLFHCGERPQVAWLEAAVGVPIQRALLAVPAPF